MNKTDQIKLLENLSKQKKFNKHFNRNFRLEKQGILEKTQELFKPIIDQQEKTNENILKAIEQNPNKFQQLKKIQLFYHQLKKLNRIIASSFNI